MKNLKVLKLVRIALWVAFISILLFYFGVIVPKYLACNKMIFEGKKGIDIWGWEIDCGTESQAFFQLFSIVLAGLATAALHYFPLKEKKISKHFGTIAT